MSIVSSACIACFHDHASVDSPVPGCIVVSFCPGGVLNAANSWSASSGLGRPFAAPACCPGLLGLLTAYSHHLDPTPASWNDFHQALKPHVHCHHADDVQIHIRVSDVLLPSCEGRGAVVPHRVLRISSNTQPIAATDARKMLCLGHEGRAVHPRLAGAGTGGGAGAARGAGTRAAQGAGAGAKGKGDKAGAAKGAEAGTAKKARGSKRRQRSCGRGKGKMGQGRGWGAQGSWGPNRHTPGAGGWSVCISAPCVTAARPAAATAATSLQCVWPRDQHGARWGLLCVGCRFPLEAAVR